MTTNANSNTQATDFAEREAALQQRDTELKAREAALERQEVTNFVEGLIKPADGKGKLLPRQKTVAVELLLALDGSQVLEFSEGETQVKTTPKKLFEEFLKGLPTVVDYSEKAPSSTEVETLTDPKVIAQLATDYREEQKAKGSTISFAEAISHVTAKK